MPGELGETHIHSYLIYAGASHFTVRSSTYARRVSTSSASQQSVSRARRILAVGVLLALLVTAQLQRGALASGASPPPSANIVGPPSASSASPVLAQVIKAWTTMKSTLYSHRYSQRDSSTGIYQFDCVGATNLFLTLGAQHANGAMRKALHIRPGFAPKPAQEASYLAGLPAAGTGL